MNTGLIDSLATIGVAVLLVAAGGGVMRGLGMVDARAGRLERLATAYAAGSIWVTTWMFLAAAAGLAITRGSAAVGLVLALFGYARSAAPLAAGVLAAGAPRSGRRGARVAVVLAGLVLAASLLVALGVVVHTGPAASHDAALNWQLKARAFFLDGDLEGALVRHRALVHHSDYPLHVPLLGTFHYLALGACRDLTGLLLHFGFLLAILGVVAGRVAAARGRVAAWAVTLALCSAPVLAETTALATADVAFAFTVLAAGAALQAFAESGDGVDLRRAAFFLFGAVWTKNEGIALALIGLALGSWLVARRGRPRHAVGLWPLALALPWLAFRASLDLTSANVSKLLPLGVAGAASSVPTVLARTADEMLAPHWLFLWPLVLAAVALVPAALRRRPALAWLVGAQLVVYLGLHILVHDGRPWLLNTTLTRLLLHLLPAALVLASTALPVAVRSQGQNGGEPAFHRRLVPGSSRRRKAGSPPF